MRLFVRSGLAVTVGYGAYITWFQTRSAQLIAERQLLPSEEYADPRIRFATMKVHGRYVNPFYEYRHQTLFEFVFCRIQELFRLSPRGDVPTDKALLASILPQGTPSKLILEGKKVKGFPTPDQRMSFTWIGQSCAFIQVPGLTSKPINILTDPMFSESVVHKNIGPQRLLPAPVQVNDLPPIDVVMVSHDHQDHLDLEAARAIGNEATWIVPTGVSKHLEQQGITNFVEMSWWTKIPLPNVEPSLGYEVACTPAMHWSGRTLLDANETLWCSFMILRHGKPLFFHAGDSGYADGLFSGIAKIYGSGCKVAMVPCGAYTPQWHLKSQHMNPQEALKVMKDLNAEKLLGVHWGTFVMSEEPYFEPKQLLEKGAKEINRIEDVSAPVFGETLVFQL